jgi:hypothetical protein
MEVQFGIHHLVQKMLLIRTVEHLLLNAQVQLKKGRDAEKELQIPMGDAIFIDNFCQTKAI